MQNNSTSRVTKALFQQRAGNIIKAVTNSKKLEGKTRAQSDQGKTLPQKIQ